MNSWADFKSKPNLSKWELAWLVLNAKVYCPSGYRECLSEAELPFCLSEQINYARMEVSTLENLYGFVLDW